MEGVTQAVLSSYCFDVDEYHRMGEAGILSPDDRVELLDGQIVVKPVIGSRHFAGVAGLNRSLARIVPDDVLVSVQGPVRLSRYSEPEPDLALLRLREDFYASDLPTVDDAWLVTEVADSSLLRDRNIKLPLYAAAGIPEYRIVDLTTNAVEVYREPEGEAYRTCERLTSGSLAPQAFPDLELAVDEMLPATT